MISAENSTLERIQREIKDVMEREKELKKYQNGINNNNNNEVVNGEVNEVKVNGFAKGGERPVLLRAQSTSVLLNGDQPKINGNTNNFRRFATNPNVKGVMQRFIKSRGKINSVNAISNQKPAPVWNPPEFSAPKLPADQTKYIRNGFVPVEERLRKEIQEEQNREIELRTQRRRSQPTFESYSLDLEDVEVEKPKFALRATKSMAQLYDSCEALDEIPVSAPGSLKQAKSLAELCDVEEDEIETPQSLIQRFERMIIKNKSAART